MAKRRARTSGDEYKPLRPPKREEILAAIAHGSELARWATKCVRMLEADRLDDRESFEVMRKINEACHAFSARHRYPPPSPDLWLRILDNYGEFSDVHETFPEVDVDDLRELRERTP